MTGIPEATARAVKYLVSCVPPDHPEASHFTLIVEQDRYGWGVHDGASGLGPAGEWEDGGVSVYGRDDAWVADHRFDLDTALELAKAAAPHVKVMGHTVEAALRDMEAEEEERPCSG